MATVGAESGPRPPQVEELTGVAGAFGFDRCRCEEVQSLAIRELCRCTSRCVPEGTPPDTVSEGVVPWILSHVGLLVAVSNRL